MESNGILGITLAELHLIKRAMSLQLYQMDSLIREATKIIDREIKRKESESK